MKLTSSAFKDNGMIPSKYTCKGENLSPPLEINDVPSNAKSLVLIVDDPDAPVGVWDHWIVWDIDPCTTTIDEGSVPETAVQGLNSWGKNNYGGPCPPSGTHRYFFKLYALDNTLTISQRSKKSDVERVMDGHILAKAELVGLFKKE